MSEMYLMHKNMPVVEINMDEGYCKIINSKFIPYQLKEKLIDNSDFTFPTNHAEFLKYNRAVLSNQTAITRYLSSRVLPLTRENAKKIYALFGFEQLSDDYSKMDVSIMCKAASLQDDYWLKAKNDDITWENINLRTNHLSEVVAQVALHGTSLTLQGELRTPELNGHGAYAKAWIREKDGLFLHKIGSNGRDWESKIEVAVSNILDKTNVYHLQYLEGQSMKKYTCKCKCMTTDRLSILPGMDYISYCNIKSENAENNLIKLDANNLYKMWITDYLISNRDRHGMNWGLYYDSLSMEILGFHPLFDHNNAFDESLMKNKDASYLYNPNRTMKESAQYAIKKCDFHFTDTIKKTDFLNADQYESFMDRANDLHIDIVRDKNSIYVPKKVSEIIKEEQQTILSHNLAKYTITPTEDNETHNHELSAYEK